MEVFVTMQGGYPDNLKSKAAIGIVGDYNPHYAVHQFTNAAFSDIPEAPAFEWIPTDAIPEAGVDRLSVYSGLLIAPGSPYRSMDGALSAIRFAREHGVPLLGT
ncbi:MAG: hypothetical protein ACYCOU_15425 [Sulfobacillus sp.]